MEVHDANERKVLGLARSAARRESGWLLFHLVMSGFLVWVALAGVAGVPVWVWWVLAGAVGSDALTSARHTAGAWCEVRALTVCPGCLADSAEMARAWSRRARCGWAGHAGVAR